jgi:molybdopterin converting factor small subunit
MKLLLKLLITGVIVLSFATLNDLDAQETAEKPGIGRGSIESQFNYVLYSSEKVEDYKMVRSWWLYSLKSQVLDTLKVLHQNLEDAQGRLSEKDKEIGSLTAAVDNTSKKLETTIKEKDSMSLLGLKTSKKIYNSVTWFVIAVMLVFLSFFILLFKRSNSVTMALKSELSENKAEFEEYRKRALVREQQVVRKLYDEILKYKSKLKQ